MPADASIYSLIRPAAQPEGPIDSYGKVLTLRNLMDQQGLQDLQRRKMEQEFADDDAFRGAARTAGSDLSKLRDLLYQGGNPTKALSVDKMITDRAKGEADLGKTRKQRLDLFRILGEMRGAGFGDREQLLGPFGLPRLDQVHVVEQRERGIDDPRARRIGTAGQLLDRADQVIAVTRLFGDQRQQQHGRPQPNRRGIDQRDQLAMGLFVIAGPHHTLSISRSPKMPNGRIISTTMIMAKPATSFIPEPR